MHFTGVLLAVVMSAPPPDMSAPSGSGCTAAFMAENPKLTQYLAKLFEFQRPLLEMTSAGPKQPPPLWTDRDSVLAVQARDFTHLVSLAFLNIVDLEFLRMDPVMPAPLRATLESRLVGALGRLSGQVKLLEVDGAGISQQPSTRSALAL